jgi:enoyl-CoA hydratase/carnithine racemase
VSKLAASRDARGVLTVTLQRPDAQNALDLDMVRAFRAALAEAPQPRALVLRSSVEGAFSIGMDLSALDAGQASGASSPAVYEATREYVALLKDLTAARFPTMAVVDGVAVGGGVDLCGACDLVFASERAAFSIAQLRKGIFPLTTSGVLIPRIGERAFLWWALSGLNYSGAKLVDMGLVTQVIAHGELDARVAQLVDRILSYVPEVLQLGMDALRMDVRLPPIERLEHLGALLALNCQIPRQKGRKGPKQS